LEIRRLQKVAELHELAHIEPHWTPEEGEDVGGAADGGGHTPRGGPLPRASLEEDDDVVLVKVRC
jgi:hypothetical protein